MNGNESRTDTHGCKKKTVRIIGNRKIVEIKKLNTGEPGWLSRLSF